MNDARPAIPSGEERDRMRVTREEALTLFRKMILIRRFEELAEEAYGRGRIGGFLHLYIGEEAVADAVHGAEVVVAHGRRGGAAGEVAPGHRARGVRRGRAAVDP